MTYTRRNVLKAGLGAGALTLGALHPAAAQDISPKTGSLSDMQPLDYGRSFICHTAPENAVRFWLESRTRMIDPESGAYTDYYQAAACKSENTFAETDLFHGDNYDFTPIFGKGLILIFRRYAYMSERYRSVTKSEEILWGSPTPELRYAEHVTELTDWEAISRATAAAIPLVTQTELSDEKTGLRAIIECPTKTMNISLPKRMYQVDTGPVALPDLSKRYEPEIEAFRLAYVAFNAPHFADFVVEQPTAVEEGGDEKYKVMHYSNPVSMPAKNRLFALGAV